MNQLLISVAIFELMILLYIVLTITILIGQEPPAYFENSRDLWTSMIILKSAIQLYVQIIRCAVRSAQLWLESANVELTSDSFAQPKQHVQCLVFPRLQRQMSRNLLEG